MFCGSNGPAFHFSFLVRASDGTYSLTDTGVSVASEAQAIADRVGAIERVSNRQAADKSGTVRLTSVPIVVNRLLVPQVKRLLIKYPELSIELIAESRGYSLTRREADLAIRFSRPVQGGTQLKARRIGQWRYALYAATNQGPEDDLGLPLILYDETLAHLPHAQWIERAARVHAAGISTLRVHDAETAIEAARAGIGQAILPIPIASQTEGLRRISPTSVQTELGSEIWLIGHADQIGLPRVSCVTNWVNDILRGGAR